MLSSNSLDTVVDWGPYGIAIHVCSRVKCSEPHSLRDQMSELNFPKIIKSPYNISIFWKDKVLAPPQLKMITPIRGPVQKTLWKVALGLGLLEAGIGGRGTPVSHQWTPLCLVLASILILHPLYNYTPLTSTAKEIH